MSIRTKSAGAARVERAFCGKKAFVAFITGGDPDIETTEKLVEALEEAGADIIEIGVPFSDPVAEGPVIQRADERALKNGCTADALFDMAARLRARDRAPKPVGVPLLFMTYANPIFSYGAMRFMERCAACGIDGVIVPDVPYEERGEFAEACASHGICQISLAAPTSAERVRDIARDAEGFLYCVSSLGVTGARSELGVEAAADIVARARGASDIPCAVGFGVSTPEQARRMLDVADGVIVGSAFVELVERYGRESPPRVARLLALLKGV